MPLKARRGSYRPIGAFESLGGFWGGPASLQRPLEAIASRASPGSFIAPHTCILLKCRFVCLLRSLSEDKKFLEPHAVPQWSVGMALRISAARRHVSQAVLRQRKWLPDHWKTVETDKRTRKTCKSPGKEIVAADTESEPKEDMEEPKDDMEQEIEFW